MLIDDTIAKLRLLEDDHEPDGWPAVRMGEITQVLDWLESVTADRDELSKQNGELLDEIGKLRADALRNRDDSEEASDLDDDADPEIDPPNADGSIFVGQIGLLAAIWNHLAAKHGKTLSLCPRHLNATIAAADEIVRVLRTPERLARADMGLDAWFISDDTGLSSKYLASVLSDRGLFIENNHPHDPADFGRCARLLDAVPELRVKLPRLSDVKHGRVWNAIYENWDAIERLYREEWPSGNGRKCYTLMGEIITAATMLL